MVIRIHHFLRVIYTFLILVSFLRTASATTMPLFSNFAADVDPHSGSATFSVPIAVPQGRGGIQPMVQLQYTSRAGGGKLGVGWTVELGSIQRGTMKGVPKYDNTDTFYVMQPGNTDQLVFDASVGVNFYRTKTEGAFSKIEFISNSYWKVTDKNGTKYFFGQSASSRESDPTDATRVFRWALDKVEDVHGNTMTVTYLSYGGQYSAAIYPSLIEYTSHPASAKPAHAKVEFLYADVNEFDGATGYYPGFFRVELYRLHTINVYTKVTGVDQLFRRYAIGYDLSNRTHRSLIQTVTEYGSDGVSALPPLTFTYSQDAQPTYQTIRLTNKANIPADFNGDARTDLAEFDSVTGTLKVYLSQGTTFAPVQTWITNFATGGKQLLGGDFNADGKADMVSFDKATGVVRVALSDGTKLTDTGTNWISGFAVNQKMTTGDLNGDGKTDLVGLYLVGTNTIAHYAMNTGSAFQEDLVNTRLASDRLNAQVFTSDFNGDGLSDLVSFWSDQGEWWIQLNPGDLRDQWGTFNYFPRYFGGGGDQYAILTTDFNVDGFNEPGYYDYHLGKIRYYLSFGNHVKEASAGVPDEQITPQIFSDLYIAYQMQAADFNGDGLADFVASHPSFDTQIAYSQGGLPTDLLTSITNGVGGTTTIAYKPSTTYSNQYLPFTTHVVDSVSVSNSRGDSYVTRYSYEGGLWDALNREFRGFKKVRVTDPENNYTVSEFLQDPPYTGRVKEQSTFNAANQLFAKTANTWNTQTIASGINFVFLKRKDNYVYDGDSVGRRTAEEYTYGETTQLGNLTQVKQLGEVDWTTGADIGTDSRTVETFYVNNTSAGNWIAGIPRQTVVKNHTAVEMRKSWFYYDGNNTNNTGLPTKGLLTKKEDWGGDQVGAQKPTTLYTYNTYGNLENTTDPRGNITTIAYDTTYQLFPLTTTNAVNHQVKNEYYGVNGVALDSGDGYKGVWGQLKSTTDPNDQVGRRVYDTFGRVVKTVGPLDTIAFPTSLKEFTPAADHVRIKTSARITSGQAAVVESVEFYDGLGRLIQKKTPSDVAGQYVLSGQTQYNSRGLPEKKYLAKFVLTPMTTMDALNTLDPYSSIQYDAVGRVVRSTNPDGTYSSVEYADWTTKTYNENGHKQESDFDAYGRLKTKREYKGADGRGSPTYPTLAYTVYATTQYVYDSEGNLERTIDHKNNNTVMTYDKLGRKTAMSDPDMKNWTYEYDVNGNLTKQIDAKGQTISFVYDALNRLNNKNDGNGMSVSYTYDDPTKMYAKGRLNKAGYAPDEQTQFEYDQLGREIKSVKMVDNITHEVQRQYDALNQLLRAQYPQGENVHYKYNAAGQVIAVGNDAALVGGVQ